jgi:hypothetical protein
VRSGTNRSLYLFLRRVVTQIVLIIEVYNFCQLRTNFIQHHAVKVVTILITYSMEQSPS